MKKTSSIQHELSIIFSTFYLLLIDESVTYFLNLRVFHTSLIQSSLIFAIQIDILLCAINRKPNKPIIKFIKWITMHTLFPKEIYFIHSKYSNFLTLTNLYNTLSTKILIL